MLKKYKNKDGFTLLEVIITLGIMVIGLLGISQMTILFLQITSDQKAHVTAIALANEKIETIRNLTYNDIGSIGGVPPGNLIQNEIVTRNGIHFNVKTEIVYIDDPFDGLITTTGTSGSIYSTGNSEILYYWNMSANTNGTTPVIGSGSLSFVGTTMDTGYEGSGIHIEDGDRITTEVLANIDPVQGRIGIWYKPDLANSAGERIFHIYTDSGYFFIRRTDNERLEFSHGSSSNSATSDTLTWIPSQWYFIEAAWDVNYKEIWRDGIPLDTLEAANIAPVLQDQMHIGNSHDDKETVKGLLDELYIISNSHKYEIWGYNQFNPYTAGNPQTTFYWNMDSGDTSQTPQVGVGTITVGGDYSVTDPGVKNTGLNLSNDGADNDYALIPDGSNIDFGNSRISFWFKPRNNSINANDDYLLTGAGCSDGTIQLIREKDNSIAFNYGSSANNVSLHSVALDWNKDFWYLIEMAFVNATDVISVFVNGVEAVSSDGVPIDAPIGCTGLYLGNLNTASNDNGDGTFDEVYILNEPFPESNPASDILNTDYKRAKITVSWIGNKSEKKLFLITDIAPPGIETTAGGGTLIINTINAYGMPVAGATINVVNDTIDPPINLSLTSGASGRLIIPGAPATSTSYQLTISKTGYSSDYTSSSTVVYPNPIKGYLSVIEAEVTESSFIIDQVSTLDVLTVSQTLPVNFKLNTDTSGENQSAPHLATGASYIYTTWQDYRDDTNFLNYNQKYNYTGTNQWLNDAEGSTQAPISNPRTALDSGENQYIVWSDSSDGDADIYIQKLTPAGSPLWNPPIKINDDPTPQTQTNPDIFFYNNELYIVWEDKRNDTGDIYFNKVNTSGSVVLGSDIKINSDSGSNTQTNPHIIVDSSGFAYISWLDDRNSAIDIYLDKVTNTGTNKWGSEIEVNGNTATNISSYDIAQDTDLETHVIWTDNRNGNYDIFFQSIASSSAPIFGSDQTITTGAQTSNQESVKIDVTTTGDFIIGWNDDRAGDHDVFVLQTDDTGTNIWTNEIQINLETTADQIISDVLVYNSDRAIAIWTDYSQGDTDVWAGTLNYSGTETPTPFVDFTLTGAKLTHQSPDKVKFEQSYTTNASGLLSVTDLEWDAYTITITEPGLTLSQSVPAIPISIDPNTTQAIKLIVD